MFKKIAIGLLVLTVLGAGGAAVAYQASTAEAEPELQDVVAEEQAHGNSVQGQQGESQGQQGEAQGNAEMVAEGALGEPWMETGIIAAIEDAGIQLSLENGETAFVELGPPDFWTTQGVTLEVGQTVSVDGSDNEGMIHATTLTTEDGQTLQLRNENGQPMWSGGTSGEQGQNGQGNSEGQMQVDEWITVEGTLMSFQGGNMTMSTVEGEILSFKTGQPRFFAEQGITFQVGDEIIVVGFYQGEEFQAGDITQVATELRVMLRDPNGRPLWAGAGNSGSGGGGGNGKGQGGNGG